MFSGILDCQHIIFPRCDKRDLVAGTAYPKLEQWWGRPIIRY
jgi:hypothetical protein